MLFERLRDERGRRVVFVSHCLLNENTRYLGGAFHSGAVPEIAELQRLGIGIHQMRCPERQAWGGTVKRLMIPAYGSNGTVLYRFRAPLLRLFVWYTRLAYWRLARAVVKDIREYQRSGVRVVAIVGVGASPSCGVSHLMRRPSGHVEGLPLLIEVFLAADQGPHRALEYLEVLGLARV